MRSGTSFFNGTLYRKTMVRFWPIWALYGLCWMFAIPLNLMTRYFDFLRWTGDPVWSREQLLDLAQSVTDFLTPGVWLAALAGLLCAMACFGYLYNSRSACMMHTLPMRRETLFLTQYLAGLSFLLLPMLAAALCGTLVELALLPAGTWARALPCLWVWFLAESSSCLFFFSFAAFCAMFTGHILALPVFYGVLNGLAGGIALLVQSLLSEFYYGFYSNFSDCMPVYYLTPLAVFTNASCPDHSAAQPWTLNQPVLLLLYAGAGLVLALLALLIYRGRQVESAGDVVSIPLVRPVFQVGVAFCSGLGLGMCSGVFFGCYDQALPLSLCILVWTVIGFFVAEMLLKKSFRVLGAWKRCLGMAAAMTVLCLVCFLDPFGIESHTPQAGEVASVQITLDNTAPYDSGQLVNLELTDPQQVQRVIDLHKTILRDKDRVASGDGYFYLYLSYTMTDGSHLSRRYVSVPLFADELEQEGTLSWQAQQLANDRSLLAQAYGFDAVEQGALVDAWLSNVYDAHSQYYDNLSMEGFGPQLWQAVRQDFDEGNLGQRYLIENEDRQENTYYTDLCFNWVLPKRSGASGSVSMEAPQSGSSASVTVDTDTVVTVTLTPQAKHTLALLEQTGLLGDRYRLQPNDREEEAADPDYFQEPDTAGDLPADYGVIGSADGPTAIVTG